MSGQKHATVSLWHRDEADGSYHAEIEGWQLTVKWTPEKSPGDAHGFSWSGTLTVGDSEELRIGSDKLYEEMNVAMAFAEDAARGHDSGDADKSGA